MSWTETEVEMIRVATKTPRVETETLRVEKETPAMMTPPMLAASAPMTLRMTPPLVGKPL
jgi:hypothetical protein